MTADRQLMDLNSVGGSRRLGVQSGARRPCSGRESGANALGWPLKVKRRHLHMHKGG